MIGYPHLRWFPKPFGAGDTDGAGSKRVLGNPEVDATSLLVREMAQNTWDARLPGCVPQFEMRLRTLDARVRDVLTWNVFGGGHPENLGLAAALADPDLCAVEVLDRGTKGLGGPTRNDVDPSPGEPADYADFVLTIGAPPEDGYGGGTYGFGKTAAYLASECSTIVIWSRAKAADGSIAERFIASAMGARFTLDAQRYTGRQWWGLPPDGPDAQAVFRVEPAVGGEARMLGESVFERHFETGETGTSILILQPKGRGDRDGLAKSWAKAITRNLWPKMDRSQAVARRMDIKVTRDGVEIPLASRATSPALDAAARCLDALRRKHVDPGYLDPLVSVEEIWCYKPKRVVGYLALMKYLDNSPDDDGYAVDSIISMRSTAELVVRDDHLGPTADGLTRWVGVFKPHPDLDPVFAAAEPPAHDSWNPNGLEDFNDRRLVGAGIRRSKEAAEAFRNPAKTDADATGSSSTGKLSAALAGLVGEAAGSRAVARSVAAGSARKGAKRPRVDVLEVFPLTRSPEDMTADRQTTRVAVSLSGAVTEMPVRPASLSVAVDGGVMASEGQVLLKQWVLEDGSVHEASEIHMLPGQKIFADINYPVGLAIEFSFVVGA